MASGSAKQKVVQSIKDVTNILVTVNNSPSVDELSAALGLTIFLNKLGKHATAVFSGDVPPAITFLKPDETFEQTADSLRDFIIALDKEKADHLRYKVVDDAVKIFITPYRTTISEKDLDFSQGDYNVELVLALNVESSDRIDTALTAHGKILHDATVLTMTAGTVKSGLGSVDWHESGVSGVSEMAVELIDDLKTPKVTLDEQMATALLTGIVAATERFSNVMTSPKVMTAAAELMAAGANQQLIVSKITESVQEEPESDNVKEDDDKEKPSQEAEAKPPKESDGAAGSLSISHEKKGDVDDVAKQTAKEQQEASVRVAQEKLARLEPVTPVNEVANIATPSPSLAQQVAPSESGTPSLGGTLSATTVQAAEDKAKEARADQNRTILRHRSHVGSEQPSFGDNPLNAAMGPSDEPASIDPFAKPPVAPLAAAPANDSIMTALANDTNQLAASLPSASTAVDEKQSALAAVDAALAVSEPSPALTPAPQPSTPTSSALPPVETAGMPTAPTMADIEANLTQPSLPPLPDFSTLPPLPPAPTGVNPSDLPPLPSLGNASPTQSPQAFDPSQFHIPGQNS